VPTCCTAIVDEMERAAWMLKSEHRKNLTMTGAERRGGRSK
jgi:hypothetical protein